MLIILDLFILTAAKIICSLATRTLLTNMIDSKKKFSETKNNNLNNK